MAQPAVSDITQWSRPTLPVLRPEPLGRRVCATGRWTDVPARQIRGLATVRGKSAISGGGSATVDKR